MELLFIGLLGGAILTYLIFSRVNAFKKRERIQSQAVILKDKIKSVCKLISVEGDFAEIYHYENVKEKFFSLLTGTKKALILIDAKAHVGFDLSKIQIESDVQKKRVILTHFPQPELLTIETDFKYYDKKEGWLNPFTSADLTEINREAKQFIVDKIPQSGLINSARKEALNTLEIMEKLAQSIGWELDYEALKIDQPELEKQLQIQEQKVVK